ncbi:MetQ/NlpA family ABC transporter substrate-binding protein [Acinetobacter soli]|uniref:MetQ/NlpA family ABC transporter substrate-binding protein n=1 Tax=Acinetobacter soli TaxID=487316 RepID=A0AB38YTI1_9GAMM|nr:MetQ/NlpA family ABC transporter substrate-binding protein [Acinetobacter soli]KQD02444.1 NLPA lipoprotein [Acinetobacter soli]WEH93145.1 MetQ/NlpA family ABC transporter substrate-binding protein [Acinetobacter soli]WEH97660.1 MetQ/NlpA family ABC transporter substrate-binding protein [Acinetobacter soli]WEH99431.1 MetQ/NlpA family ABC transporter substrate-binding protein [Acinetobacter soli]WND04520.1 MetQ/NlpA family ABC transporter substrate-binding protein [Acinetobacter soli]
MKKVLSVVLTSGILLAAGCSKKEPEQGNAAAADQTKKIVLASTGSDTDVWKFIATLPETKQAGINLEVKNFTDYVAMNKATANKEIDVNAFQSYNYMVAYNTESKDKVAPVSTTYIEPMGLYSDKYKKIDQFPAKATIAIPNDAANEARALSLLQTAGLIKLKADFNPIQGTTNDVIENPKQIQLKTIPMATAVRVKSDVDGIVLGNTLAMEGGLNVLKDAVFYEPADQSTKLYVNLLVTAEGRQNDPVLQKLGTLYHTEAVKKFIDEKFGGTKVDVNKPISYLTESK